MNRRKTTPNSATGAICSTLPKAKGASQVMFSAERPNTIRPKQNPGAQETEDWTDLKAPEQRHDDARRREKNQRFLVLFWRESGHGFAYLKIRGWEETLRGQGAVKWPPAFG